jgi:hypothetical protein
VAQVGKDSSPHSSSCWLIREAMAAGPSFRAASEDNGEHRNQIHRAESSGASEVGRMQVAGAPVFASVLVDRP